MSKVVFNPVHEEELQLYPADEEFDARYFIVDTKANILASIPENAKVGLATDTDEFYLYDTNDSEWKVAPLELKAESANPDMGAYDAGYLGTSDKAGYGSDYISDKRLSNMLLGDSDRDEEGSFRLVDGTFQIYANSTWNDVVINFRLREDNNGSYEFEHKPIGFNYWIEIMSGNSDQLGLNGLPIIQQYGTSMGAYQVPLVLNGGSF